MAITFSTLLAQTYQGNAELFTVDFTTCFTYNASGPSVIQFCNEREDTDFDGDTYVRTSAQFLEPEYSLDETNTEAKLIIQGQDVNLKEAFFYNESLYGATMIRLIVPINHLDNGVDPDTSQKEEEIWYLDNIISRNKEQITINAYPSLGLSKIRQPALSPITAKTYNV